MTSALAKSDAYTVRGWCPSGMRPMQTGDGLIVRLNPRGKSLSCVQLIAIAAIAERYGNGLIDLTRRANLQLRGAREADLPRMWDELERVELLDREPVPSILVGPLAGVDPTELVDASQIAGELAQALSGPAFAALPAKFAFVIDGGGALPLDSEAADIRLRAVLDVEAPGIAMGVDRPGGMQWLGHCKPESAANVAATLTAKFLSLRSPSERHLRELSETAVAKLVACVELAPLPRPCMPRTPSHPLGAVRVAGELIAVGLAAPFGRITASALRRLGEDAVRAAINGFRLSPWRSLYALTSDEAAASALVAHAKGLDFIVDPADPMLAIDACPGSPSCLSAAVDTRSAAQLLAPMLQELGLRSLHISGCSKGCARSAPADLTLVGAAGAFAIVHNGTARCTPSRIMDLSDLAADPQLLRPA
jgi:precorrin-3B synthase